MNDLVQQRDLVRDTYLATGASYRDLAKQFSIDPETILLWMKEDKWPEKRQQESNLVVQEARINRDLLVSVKEKPLLEDQLAIIGKVQKALLSGLVHEDLSLCDLASVSRIVKDLGDAASHILPGPKQEVDNQVSFKTPFLTPRVHPSGGEMKEVPPEEVTSRLVERKPET